MDNSTFEINRAYERLLKYYRQRPNLETWLMIDAFIDYMYAIGFITKQRSYELFALTEEIFNTSKGYLDDKFFIDEREIKNELQQ